MRQYGRAPVHVVEVKGPGHQHLTMTPTKSGRAKARRRGRKTALQRFDEAADEIEAAGVHVRASDWLRELERTK